MQGSKPPTLAEQENATIPHGYIREKLGPPPPSGVIQSIT